MGTIIRNGIIYGGGSAGLLPHLVIEADPSSTVTVSKGQTSITATETSSGIYECDVAEFGTYTINGTLNGASVEGTLVVDTVMVYNYAFTIPVPEGATVTPVNDIQTWLKCAGLDKEYTTLAEVLADTETFDILLRDSNACDYMARSTDWAVAEGLVPAMTSATTPSGTVSANSEQNANKAYMAFDGNRLTQWVSNVKTYPCWLEYDFGTPTKVTRVRLFPSNGAYVVTQTAKIQGYNGTDWVDLTDSFTHIAQGDNDTNRKYEYFELNSVAEYSKYRLLITANSSGAYYPCLGELQFYSDADITTNEDAMSRVGKYDYCSEKLLSNATWCEAICNSSYMESILDVKAPTMTSRTTPYGKVIAPADSGQSNTQAWRAFDGTNYCWYYNANHTIGYQFTGVPIIVKKFTIQNRFDNLVAPPKKFNFVGSNDEGTTWVVIKSNLECLDRNYATIMDFEVSENETAYQAYGIQTTEMYDNVVWIAELQFYGRKSISDTYYPLVPAMTSNTQPSGEVSASSIYASGREGWKAFSKGYDDGTTNTMWVGSPSNYADEWLEYEFPSPAHVNAVTLSLKAGMNNSSCRDGSYKVQASDDGTTYTDIATVPFTKSLGTTTTTFENSEAHKYWRIKTVTSNWATNDYPNGYTQFAWVQFYEKITKGIIHSAPNDTIYTLDENFDPVILCYTNGEGIGELDYADFGAKNVRLYSSVAKDPSNVTVDYYKQVQITNTIYGGTTEIYLMPDCVRTLYWWGYIGDNCESLSVENGWTYHYYNAFSAPTYNTTNVVCASLQTYFLSGIGTKNTIASADVVKGIVNGKGSIFGKTSKSYNNPDNNYVGARIDFNNNALTTVSSDVSSGSNFYVGMHTGEQSFTAYALWYE